MKPLLKKYYLIGALSFAVVESTSAATININSSSSGLGSSSDCTLTGAIQSIEKQYNVQGCVSSGTYGVDDLIWADITQTGMHFLEEGQLITRSVTINLSMKDIGGKLENVTPFSTFLFPTVFVDTPQKLNSSHRHFQIMNTSNVRLVNMELRGAYFPAKVLTTDFASMKAVNGGGFYKFWLWNISTHTGGSVYVDNSQNIEFDHVRFVNNRLGALGQCTVSTDNPPEQISLTWAMPQGTAVGVEQSTVNFTDVDFEGNSPEFFSSVSKDCPPAKGSDENSLPLQSSTGTLYAKDSQITLKRSRFIGNEGDFGAAVYHESRPSMIKDSLLSLEEVEILNNYPTLYLFGTKSAAHLNFYDLGEARNALEINGANAQLKYVSMNENKGIALVVRDNFSPNGTVTVQQSAIVGNELNAVVNESGNVMLENVLISGNMKRFPPYDRKDGNGQYDVGVRVGLSNVAQATLSTVAPKTILGGWPSAKTYLSHVTVADNHNTQYALYSHDEETLSQGGMKVALPTTEIFIKASILSHTVSPTTCYFSDHQANRASLGANLDNNDNTCQMKTSNSPQDFDYIPGFDIDLIGQNPGLSGISLSKKIGSTLFLSEYYNSPITGSPALARETKCSVNVDQIAQPRSTEVACDSGAIEVQ